MNYFKSVEFLNLIDRKVFDPNMQSRLSVAHLTSVPPIFAMQEFDLALRTHKKFRSTILSHKNFIAKELNFSKDLKEQEYCGVIFGMQCIPNDLTHARLEQLRKAGVRVMPISLYGYANYTPYLDEDEHLTKKGEALIHWINDERIILDLSHTKTKIGKLNILNFIKNEGLGISVMINAGCSVLNNMVQNISDEIIQSVHQLKGHIGIPFDEFVLGAFPIDAHVRHVTKVCGGTSDSSCVGIGCGNPYTAMTLWQARDQYEKAGKIYARGNLGSHNSMLVLKHGLLLKHIAMCHMDRHDNAVFTKNFRSFLERSLP